MIYFASNVIDTEHYSSFSRTPFMQRGCHLALHSTTRLTFICGNRAAKKEKKSPDESRKSVSENHWSGCEIRCYRTVCLYSRAIQ